MKIMKIFGVVVGIHVFFIISAFVIPGCSSASKPTPKPDETVAKAEPPPMVSAAPAPMESPPSLLSPAPVTFGPEPAVAPSANPSGMRFPPTRPGSAAASTLAAPPVTNVTPAQRYTVKSGDNFSTIAKRNGITTAELAAANNLKLTAVLHPGQVLLVPAKRVAAESAPTSAKNGAAANNTAATTAVAPAASNVVKHTVKFGESLSSIAQQYGVKVRELGSVNHISDPQKLRAGAELIIPGWQATGKSGGQRNEPAVKSGASTSGETNSLFNPATPAPAEPRPATGNEVPVIRVEEPAPAAPRNN